MRNEYWWKNFGTMMIYEQESDEHFKQYSSTDHGLVVKKLKEQDSKKASL